MKIVIASKDTRHARLIFDFLSSMYGHKLDKIYFIHETDGSDLSKQIHWIQPDWAFFFHWGQHIPEKVYKNHRCVTLHVSNLPHGRGGSPIQNQIMDNITFTRVNALVTTDPFDSGDVYCSKEISLQGSLDDIWSTLARAAIHLIETCIFENPTPTPQKGTPHVYKRLYNNELKTTNIDSMEAIYDQIRMLDGEGYPTTYIDHGDLRLEFSRAKFDGEEVLCDVRISYREDDE